MTAATSTQFVHMLTADIRAAIRTQMLPPAALAAHLVENGWRPAEVTGDTAGVERFELLPPETVRHHPRAEELEPGRGTALVCAIDDQSWPCDHEKDLTREEPDHG